MAPPIYEFRVCPRAILQSQSHKVDDNINFGPTQVSPDLPFFRLQGEPCPVHEADIITMLLHAKAYIEAGKTQEHIKNFRMSLSGFELSTRWEQKKQPNVV